MLNLNKSTDGLKRKTAEKPEKMFKVYLKYAYLKGVFCKYLDNV